MVPGPSEIPVLSKDNFEGDVSDRENISQRPQAQIFPLFGMNNMCVKQIGQ